jgi:hypothetical protein
LEIGVRVYEKLVANKPGITRVEHYTRSWPLLQGIEGKKYFYESGPGLKKSRKGLSIR